MKSFSNKIHFICGKGGVGKSVIACTLARSISSLNKKVLLIQVNTLDSHSDFLLLNNDTKIIYLLPAPKCIHELKHYQTIKVIPLGRSLTAERSNCEIHLLRCLKNFNSVFLSSR